MPATSKAELIARTEADYAKLRSVIDTIPAAQALRPREEETSIKDVVAHRAHWITLYLGWYADGQAGREVHFPAPGYNWGQLKAYNAALRAEQKALDWDAARAMLDAQHRALIGFLEARSEQELYGGPMKGARNDWTAGRWAEAAGPSHYRSALKWIRACLREDSALSD